MASDPTLPPPDPELVEECLGILEGSRPGTLGNPPGPHHLDSDPSENAEGEGEEMGSPEPKTRPKELRDKETKAPEENDEAEGEEEQPIESDECEEEEEKEEETKQERCHKSDEEDEKASRSNSEGDESEGEATKKEENQNEVKAEVKEEEVKIESKYEVETKKEPQSSSSNDSSSSSSSSSSISLSSDDEEPCLEEASKEAGQTGSCEKQYKPAAQSSALSIRTEFPRSNIKRWTQTRWSTFFVRLAKHCRLFRQSKLHEYFQIYAAHDLHSSFSHFVRFNTVAYTIKPMGGWDSLCLSVFQVEKADGHESDLEAALDAEIEGQRKKRKPPSPPPRRLRSKTCSLTCSIPLFDPVWVCLGIPLKEINVSFPQRPGPGLNEASATSAVEAKPEEVEA